MLRLVFVSMLISVSSSFATAQEEYSGIVPSLAVFNTGTECGIGTVVPWADRIWITTYSAHVLDGHTDRLFEITPDLLSIKKRPELGGSTPTGRLIHKESNQLFIGSYAIDAKGRVREIPVAQMPGRITAIARHLHDPANKVYFATMEEGLYEVDVRTLQVECLIRDGNWNQAESNDPYQHALRSKLPGYHGKGLYSGQGLLIYSNNGEDKNPAAISNPLTPSGALASWQGSGDWHAFRIFDLTAGKALNYEFPPSFQAYWIRFKSDTNTSATAQFTYR